MLRRHWRMAWYLAACDVHLMKHYGFTRRRAMRIITEWRPLLHLAFDDHLEPAHAVDLLLKYELDMHLDEAFRDFDVSELVAVNDWGRHDVITELKRDF